MNKIVSQFPNQITLQFPENLEKNYCPLIVVLLGHIDHGKTSLLEAISEKKFIEKEAGEITQQIRTVQIEKDKKKITFIDTPGHEAFLELRKRGVQITDIALLIIAADEGIKSQTFEVINSIQEAKIPFIVVITKVDKKEANVQKIKQQLAEKNILIEEFGGKVICQEVSSKDKRGIDQLLEMIFLLFEMEGLKKNLDGKTEGVVIESWINPKKGVVTNLLVQKGILKEGDIFVCGSIFGKIKALENFEGKRLKKVLARTPVKALGFNAIVKGGEIFQIEENFLNAKKKTEIFTQLLPNKKEKKEISFQKTKEKELQIVIKVDREGSIEAMLDSLKKIEEKIRSASWQTKLRLKILKIEVGNITEEDIFLAKNGSKIVFGFNVKIDKKTEELAKIEGVKIKNQGIIYKLIDEIKESFSEMLEPEIIEEILGKIKILVVFKTISRSENEKEMVVGGKIIDGKIEKGAILKIYRKEKNIGLSIGQAEEAKLLQLQIERQDVQEAGRGSEVGMKVLASIKIEVDDMIEVVKRTEKKRELF